MIPKCLNEVHGMTVGYPRSGMVLGLKLKGKVKIGMVMVFHNNSQSITPKRMIPECSNLV